MKVASPTGTIEIHQKQYAIGINAASDKNPMKSHPKTMFFC